MANTITSLRPTLFEMARIVSREPIGLAMNVRQDFDSKGAGLNDTIKVPVSPSQTTATFTPAATSTSGTDRTLTSIDVTISKTKKTTFNITGEEEASLTAGGNISLSDSSKQSMQQAFRVLANELETDLGALYVQASRVFGTAGTDPFGSNFDEISEVRRILTDNGAPAMDRKLVVDTAASIWTLSASASFTRRSLSDEIS